MALSEPNTAVHLKNSQGCDTQFFVLSGFFSLLFVPIAIVGVARGEWGHLGTLAIPAASAALGALARRMSPADYAVLYPDRIELPCHSARERVVAWSEVTEIRWPAVHRRNDCIKLVIPRRNGRIFPRTLVQLSAFSPADRLTFIRYLRLAGAEVEQTGWPAFCGKVAVPLVETCQRDADDAEKGVDKLSSRPEEVLERLFEQPPLLIGLLAPWGVLRMILQSVSRKMWWLLAAILAISAVINIRLVWGFWAAPFSQFILGVAGAMFLLGVFAPPERCEDKSRGIDLPGVPFWFAVALIGGPFVMNAAVLRWIPAVFAQCSVLAALFCLMAPCYIGGWKAKRREKQTRPAREADALRRWEVYERTGQLPSSELPS